MIRYERLDLAEARRAAYAASGLGFAFHTGELGAEEVLAHLSSIQIDTLSVVERAHHHILWSRLPRYAKAHLAALEAEPRRAIEYWSHAAAILPIAEYRYCIPRMERVREEGHDWFEYDPAVVELVRERIKAEGPLRVKDFAAKGAELHSGTTSEAEAGGGWWEWKPAKVALEYLFQSGELVSISREGFQKRYELAERALPRGLDLRRPSMREMASWYVDTAARTLGLFAAREVAYQRKDMLDGIPAELEERVSDGRLVRLALEGGKEGEGLFAAPEALESAAAPKTGRARVFVLSPFDPLLIDRRRFSRLFGEDFQIECYLPAAKRRFGYFALPLMFLDPSGGFSFAGRLDAKADRKAGLLELRRLSVQGIASARRDSFAAALAKELGRFALFNGCRELSLGRVEADRKGLAEACEEKISRARLED